MDKIYLVHGNTWYEGYGHCENLYGVFTDRKMAEKVRAEVIVKLYEKEMHNIKITENKSDNVIILVPLRMSNKFSSVVLHTINNIDVAKGQIIRFERGY